MITAKIVLLKYFDHRQGLVFFTNYESKKARHIEAHSQISLLFFWIALERQVQIAGNAVKISAAKFLQYFATCPRGSQIGAWCSQQSSIISSRQILEMKFDERLGAAIESCRKVLNFGKADQIDYTTASCILAQMPTLSGKLID